METTEIKINPLHQSKEAEEPKEPINNATEDSCGLCVMCYFIWLPMFALIN